MNIYERQTLCRTHRCGARGFLRVHCKRLVRIIKFIYFHYITFSVIFDQLFIDGCANQKLTSNEG
jgi:hypothetical protein